MNTEIPTNIGRSKVILYSQIDQRHIPTGTCKNEIDGVLMKNAKWAAITQYDNDSGYYLFFCYESDQLSDTYHGTIEEAKEQAEFEYEGITSTWKETT